jgi:hypothetical protein
MSYRVSGPDTCRISSYTNLRGVQTLHRAATTIAKEAGVAEEQPEPAIVGGHKCRVRHNNT